MNQANIALLKQAIENEVFVTKEEVRIVNGNSNRESNWLMDFRSILMQPSYMKAIAESFLDILERESVQSFQVGGLEVAAIPIISAMVMKSLERNEHHNGFFIRKSRKKTGLLNMIEGKLTEDPIVLVDDIINSGSSFMRQIKVIEELGKKVEAVVVILRFRDIDYYQELHARGIKIFSLFTLDDFTSSLGVKNHQLENIAPTPYPFKIEWGFRSPEAHYEYVIPKSAPALDKGTLYFGADNGYFWAINAKDGSVLWSHKVLFGTKGKLIFSSPVIAGDTVFFGAYDGNLYALDKSTGKIKWIAYDADWIGSSPCVAPDLGLVYVGMEFGFWKQKGGIAAYDIHTGKRVWQSESSEYTHGSPTYSKKYKTVICGSNDGIVFGLHAKTGKVIWTYQAGGEIKAGCALSASEKYVAFGSFNKQFVVLETKTGKLVSTFDTLESNYSTPAWEGDEAIICGSLDKRIYKFGVKVPGKIWEYVTSARIFASPLIYQGKVYCGNNSARLHILSLDNGKEIALHQCTERITNRVVFDLELNRLYVPTFANEIIALSPLNIKA